jgi:hypothetical protein
MNLRYVGFAALAILTLTLLVVPVVRAANNTPIVNGQNGQQCVASIDTVGSLAGCTLNTVWESAPADSKGNIIYGTDGTPTQLVVCNQEAQYDTNTNGLTQIIGPVSGKRIYVCGYSFFAAGTVSVNLNQGTGTNCATGTNNKMSPTYQLTGQTGIVDSRTFGASTGPNISVAGQALCIQTNAAVAVQARVQYAQF